MDYDSIFGGVLFLTCQERIYNSKNVMFVVGFYFKFVVGSILHFTKHPPQTIESLLLGSSGQSDQASKGFQFLRCIFFTCQERIDNSRNGIPLVGLFTTTSTIMYLLRL